MNAKAWFFGVVAATASWSPAMAIVMETANPADTVVVASISPSIVTLDVSFIVPTPVDVTQQQLIVYVPFATPVTFPLPGPVPLIAFDSGGLVNPQGRPVGDTFTDISADFTYTGGYETVTALQVDYSAVDYSAQPVPFIVSGQQGVSVSTPEPSAWATMLIGLALSGGAIRIVRSRDRNGSRSSAGALC